MRRRAPDIPSLCPSPARPPRRCAVIRGVGALCFFLSPPNPFFLPHPPSPHTHPGLATTRRREPVANPKTQSRDTISTVVAIVYFIHNTNLSFDPPHPRP
uniref:Uncharacterized protein n=1 Tax=Human herpesvirus 2 TaxID=10310 RepID=A0A481T6E0_HHV2|nr:hypothetical protein [Human alphaherpesvirus 2]